VTSTSCPANPYEAAEAVLLGHGDLAERTAFFAHLAQCPACREQFVEASGVVFLLKEALTA